MAVKGTALDVKLAIEKVKAGFEKDQTKAAKKIVKLTKQVEELDGQTAEQQADISDLNKKIAEMEGGNILLARQVEKFSGDAKELSKLKDVLQERTRLLKETSHQFQDMSEKYKEE